VLDGVVAQDLNRAGPAPSSSAEYIVRIPVRGSPPTDCRRRGQRFSPPTPAIAVAATDRTADGLLRRLQTRARAYRALSRAAGRAA